MGLIMKNGQPYGGSGDMASNIAYDSTSSGLPASTVQSAIDYLNENGIGKVDTEGIIVNVEIGNWIEQSDGTFTNTITVSEVTAKDIYDVSLYGDFSEEQAEAFDFLVSSIDTLNGKVVLTASEQIDVAFSIILRGRVNLEDKNVFVSDLSATSIEYDNSKSGLDATNMQNAMDEVATMVNGIVVNISADSWDLQDDGTYKKIVALEQITGNETLDVCLYPGDMHTQEQIVAFSELVTSIDTAEGMITLTAVEEITVSFRIFLYGKVNFDKNNLVALTDNIIEIIPISEEEFEKKSDAEKAAGNYLVDDGEDDEFLSARNIEFDGYELGMEADNVHDAISELNSNFEEIDISNLITPVTGVTLNNLVAKRYGKDVYITAYAEWTTSAKTTRLFNIDESLTPITPVLSSCYINMSNNYYFGYVSIDDDLLASAVIGTSTTAIRINLHWRTI